MTLMWIVLATSISGSSDRRNSMENLDSPLSRVKPLPLPFLLHAYGLAHATGLPAPISTLDMAVIAYYFLMLPGDYDASYNDDQMIIIFPFIMKDVWWLFS